MKNNNLILLLMLIFIGSSYTTHACTLTGIITNTLPSQGEVLVEVNNLSGGSGQYSYITSPDMEYEGGGGNSESWNVKANGIYQIIVTDSVTGCQLVKYDTITSLSCNVHDTITYTYLGNGQYHFIGLTNAIGRHYIYTSNFISGGGFNSFFRDTLLSFTTTLPQGLNYVLFFSYDTCCCFNMDSITINVPTYSSCNITLTDSLVNATCANNNAKVSLLASGGISPYIYKNGINSSWQSSPIFTGLAAEPDTFYVKDSVGCTQLILVNIGIINVVTIYDTSHVTLYDTTHISVYDTTFIAIAVTDTLYINVNLTGIIAPNNVNELKVYPNPAKTNIYIYCGNYVSMSGYTITITNDISQIVFSTLISQQLYDINLGTWTGHGLYNVTIYDLSNHAISTKEIILQ